MREKFIKRLKKRLVISTLTMFVILSQTAPMVASAASNSDIMNAINNEIGTEISIVVEEDAIETTTNSVNPILLERAQSRQEKNTKTTTTNTTKSASSGYSSDGREYKDTWTGVYYKTAKYWSEQNPELKSALDNYFGEKNLVNTGDINGKGERATLWRTITYKDSVYKALKNKTQRDALAKISVKNGVIEKESYAAAPYVGLFEYYGIINRDDGLLNYSNSTKAYLSREQSALMLGRFMHPDSYFGKAMKDNNNKTYDAYVDHYDSNMLIGSGTKAVTDKELSASMTRIEFIYLLTESYFPDEVYEASETKKTSADIFKDVKEADFVTTAWSKKVGSYGKGTNEAGRTNIKYKKLNADMDAHIEAAYKLGILKKDSKGNANLFQNITYSEAVRMLINAGIGCADGN